MPSEKKNTGIVADTVANVSAALLTYHNAAIRAVARAGEGKHRSFNKITGNWVMLLNDLS